MDVGKRSGEHGGSAFAGGGPLADWTGLHPTHRRGHGYGSAVTAAAAAWVLRGADEVVLFTDLANPVSNVVYQRIGFRPVSDSARISFSVPR